MSKARQVFGIVMTVGVIGLTIYAIKKYYDSKKQEEQSIGLDEAKEIVADGKLTDAELDALLKNDLSEEDKEYVETHAYYKTRAILNNEQMEEIKEDARDQAAYDSSFMQSDSKVVLGPQKRRIGFTPDELAAMKEEEKSEEEEGYDPLLDGDDPQEIQDSKGYFEVKEGMEELRYEPNSIDAREQFIGMELASLGRENDTRDIVGMLYDHPFVPSCDEDRNLMMRLIDHRVRFFGLTSRWNKEVSYGDVIMYYGRSAEYNCDNDVRYWVDYFLTCGDLNNITFTSDEFDDRIELLNAHKFFNEDSQSYGLFGLTAKQMADACAVAKGRIDECVTYDIEFNQFLQGVV